MRFLVRYILIVLPLLWPVILNAQLMDKGSEKPRPAGGNPVGAWMADSTAMPVWAADALLNLVADPSIDGTVSGNLSLDADSGTYEADYVTSVHVMLTIPLLSQSIDSTFVDTVKEAGAFNIEDANLILAPSVEDGEMAVSDTLGFTARDDSLFVIQVVPLPPQYASIMASFQLEAPLAILGFAKVEDDSEPPPVDPPEPGKSADFNEDRSVDFGDFILFAQNFGRSAGDEDYDAKFDLTGDNRVDFSDFIAFARQFDQ
jgi:hypothetical protein